MFVTAAFGATFVGMQAFEWTKLIFDEGVRPWGNPMGAAQFGSAFFMITGFHGLHVTAGVIYLLVVALRLLRVGEQAGNMGEMMERIAAFHDEETARWAELTVRLFGPLLMLVIGLLIGAIVVLLYLPIFQLAENIR